MRTKIYSLPGGYLDATGRIHRSVELGEMTGKVQAAIVSDKGNMARAANVIFKHCVKRLGDMSDLNAGVWKTMFGGDRDYLMFHAMRPWGTDVVTGHIDCSCKNRYAIPRVELSNFTKYVLKHQEPLGESADSMCPIEIIEDVERSKVSGEEHIWRFKMKDDEQGVNAVFQLACGINQEDVAPIAVKNGADGRHTLYSLLCLEWDGKPGKFTPDHFSDLPTSTLDYIWEQLRFHTPGLEPLDVEGVCPSCSTITEATLADFLPKTVRGRRSSTSRSR